MTLKQVRREVEPQGFTFKDSLEFLPWQHIIIFEKPAQAPNSDPKEKDTARGSAKSKPASTGQRSAENRSR
jgi:hypothetical protein